MEENKMENKLLNDNELEMVSGGWGEGAPASVTTCPCCGIMDTGGSIVTGYDPKTGIICCHNPKCRLRFEVYLEGNLSGTHTGKYYVDNTPVSLDDYKKKLHDEGII